MNAVALVCCKVALLLKMMKPGLSALANRAPPTAMELYTIDALAGLTHNGVVGCVLDVIIGADEVVIMVGVVLAVAVVAVGLRAQLWLKDVASTGVPVLFSPLQTMEEPLTEPTKTPTQGFFVVDPDILWHWVRH